MLLKRYFLLLPILLTACVDADVKHLMEAYLWEKQVLLIFAPSLEHPAYQQQQQALDREALAAQDVVIWQIIHESQVTVDGRSRPQLGTPLFYDYFNVPTDGFALILLGKDGEEKTRTASTLPQKKILSLLRPAE
jgi:hypothetical protein